MEGLPQKLETKVSEQETKELLLRVEDFPLPKQIIEQIKETIANPEHYIDQGGAAIVYRLPGACIKVMKDRHSDPKARHYDLGNTAEEEIAFLKHMSGFSVDSVRTPAPIGLVGDGHPGGINAIVMRELPAVNLQHAINETKLFPLNFEIDRFFDALEAYVGKMHDEKKVAHGDLEARNIMIDNETGMPYVIDFGRSRFLHGTSEDKKHTNADWDTLDRVYEQVNNIDKK